MLSSLLVKTGAMSLNKERQPYYPRPSSAGPERCIRAMVYHAMEVPEDRLLGDRFALTMEDSSWHEELSVDLMRKTTYSVHSQQMAVDCAVLPFIREPEFFSGRVIEETKQFFQKIHSPDKETHREAVRLKLLWLRERGWKWCYICQQLIPLNVIHGHIDWLYTDQKLTNRLLEHKALNCYGFERYWFGDGWPMDYFTQGTLYLEGVRKIDPDINEFTLLIKNKNTAQYMDYLLRYDHEADRLKVLSVEHSNGDVRESGNDEPLVVFDGILKTAIDRFADVEKRRIERKLPLRPHALGTNFPCGYCGWEETCMKHYVESAEGRNVVEQSEISLELAELIRQYYDAKEAASAANKKKAMLKEDIVPIMNEAEIKGGKVGDLQVSLTIAERHGIDQDLLTMEERERAAKVTTSETLRVTRPKKKEDDG